MARIELAQLTTIRRTAIERGERFYFDGSICKRNHESSFRYSSTGNCVECVRAQGLAKDKILNRARVKRWTAENHDRAKARTKQWVSANRKRVGELRKNWRENNLERARELGRNWARLHQGESQSKRTAYQSERHARKLRAMPTWVSRDQLEAIYKNCPAGYHVDHIIPLKNHVVCGLHVPWNLQYLPATENMQKKNKFTPFIISESGVKQHEQVRMEIRAKQEATRRSTTREPCRVGPAKDHSRCD